jgi:hypothetical protein
MTTKKEPARAMQVFDFVRDDSLCFSTLTRIGNGKSK